MRKDRIVILLILLALAICGVLAVRAQDQSAVLKPPPGARIALVVFEDLQCPDCAAASPLLHKAAREYNIPLVVEDFPLPRHEWSFDAAVIAHYFDSRSKTLGDEFRTYLFEHQPEITKDNLRSIAEKFAKDQGASLPFAYDPQGKLAHAVRASQSLGMRVGVSHTPTIYVVTDSKTGTPFVEVVSRDDLYAMIDEMKKTVE
jgi:protein-disulfide isomerase